MRDDVKVSYCKLMDYARMQSLKSHEDLIVYRLSEWHDRSSRRTESLQAITCTCTDDSKQTREKTPKHELNKLALCGH